MQDPISKIVLQNIKVLANGQNIDKPESEREANSVKAVTLLVTPEQAEKLALASSEGKLQLVMRNSIDQGDEQTKGINKRTLLGGDRADPVPDPGSLKSEQPKQNPRPMARPVRVEPKPVAEAAPSAAARAGRNDRRRQETQCRFPVMNARYPAPTRVADDEHQSLVSKRS